MRGPGGERGIWFFSLEASRLLAVLGARSLYGLAYRWARMDVSSCGDTIEYRSHHHRSGGSADCQIRIRFYECIQTEELECFLTARFRLYTIIGGKLAFADVEHEPWPLRRAKVIECEQNLLGACGLPQPQTEPIVHYSPGVHVRIGAPELLPHDYAPAGSVNTSDRV